MKKYDHGRRTFLKATTMAAAGIAVAATGAKKAFTMPSGWSSGMQINPAIDNLRVVACRDPSMETGVPLKWDTTSQNKIIDQQRVSAVMDAMACSLAQKADPTSAWAVILNKPESKSWQNVKAAIKVNCAGSMHPRAAIVDKICRVLNGFGVPFSNITIYDMVDDAIANYAGFKGTLLPADVLVSNQTDAFPVTVAGESRVCTNILKDADILVNCGTNKPHNPIWAGITMTCKNHVGTVPIKLDNHGSNCPGSLEQLFNINKHEAILGTPATGIPCRQQLCILDSIWSSDVGDWSAIPNMPLYYLVMGTFGPAVDYLTTRKIRVDLMHCVHPETELNKYITYFDYSDADRQNLLSLTPDKNSGRGWVEVPAPPIKNAARPFRLSPTENGRTIDLISTDISGRSHGQKLYFPAKERIIRASIYSPDGRRIRSFLPLPDGLSDRLEWDGRTDYGLGSPSGQYYLNLHGTQTTRSFHITMY